MKCNCKWAETIIAIAILVFVFWETVASMWIIVIAAVLLLIHAWTCKNCGVCAPEGMSKSAAKSSAKKRRR